MKGVVHVSAAPKAVAQASRPVRANVGATLPYTGMNAGLIGLLGIASVAGGVALCRRVGLSRP